MKLKTTFFRRSVFHQTVKPLAFLYNFTVPSTMRMWMVPPICLCTKHLNGEHGEIHKHKHNFEKRHSITNRYGQIEPMSMKIRHDELAEEMSSRGGSHKSPYDMPDISYLPERDRLGKVDIEASMILLCRRCPECRERINRFL